MKKKILSLLLITTLMLSLSACDNNESSSKEPAAEEDIVEEDIAEEEPDASDDELSQSEWMEKYGNDLMEDGYEKVESINIDSGDTKLEYVSNERFTTESGEELLLVNFDFYNVSAGTTSLDAQYNFSAFQDGVEISVYSWLGDATEGDINRGKEILDGASIYVSVGIEPANWESPIKLRVDDAMAYDDMEIPHTFQQQELSF